MSFYKRIRDLREDADLTQIEICKILNIAKNTYINYEKGIREPPFEIIIKLADYYKVSLEYLAGLSNLKSINNCDISESENKILDLYKLLNNDNKIKLAERAEMLIELQHQEKTSTKRRDVG